MAATSVKTLLSLAKYLAILLLIVFSLPVMAEASDTMANRFEYRDLIKCELGNSTQQCVESIHVLRANSAYQHPDVQLDIAHWIMRFSDNHPPVLDLADDIVSALLLKDPDNYRYKVRRAYVRYRKDAISGIWDAKGVSADILSGMLDIYLRQGKIQRDIKRLSMDAVQESLDRDEYIHYTLSAFGMSFDRISRYGNAEETAAFISHAKKLIPWEDWQPIKWVSPTGKLGLTPGDDGSTLFIVTYCQSRMLMLDDGTFCADAVSLLSQDGDLKTLAEDEEFLSVGKHVISKIEELQPKSIGRAQELLERLIHVPQK